jgi:hypothetical protein
VEIMLQRGGGTENVYGVYIGGSALDITYRRISDNEMTYQFVSQRCNTRTISIIEQQLMVARIM